MKENEGNKKKYEENSLISLSLYGLLDKLKNEDHVSCLSNLASRLLSEFFQVPEFK